jgi:hypothetical protein
MQFRWFQFAKTKLKPALILDLVLELELELEFFENNFFCEKRRSQEVMGNQQLITGSRVGKPELDWNLNCFFQKLDLGFPCFWWNQKRNWYLLSSF